MRSLKNITGIVLAGGESRRMGSPKPFLEFRGKKLIGYPLDLLHSFCSEVLIVTKDSKLYRDFNAKVVTDIHENVGPIAGVYAGLKAATHPWSIVLGCDLPFVRRTLLEGIIKEIRKWSQQNAVIPLAPKNLREKPIRQVLCAAYSKGSLPFLEKKINQGTFSLIRKMPKTRYIPWRKLDPKDFLASSFINLNSKEEYKKWNNLKTI